MDHPVDTNFLVNAWLDVHFQDPIEQNPLLSGMKRSLSSLGPGSDPSPELERKLFDSISMPPPPKRPRLISEASIPARAQVSDVTHRLYDEGDRIRHGEDVGGVNGVNPDNGDGQSDRDKQTTDAAPENAFLRSPSTIHRFASVLSISNSSNSSTPPPAVQQKSLSTASFTSKSTTTNAPDTHQNRLALSLCVPSGSFGIPDLNNQENNVKFPEKVSAILQRLSPSEFEFACIPQTPEIERILARYFPHERLLPHTRLHLTNKADHLRAEALVNFAIRIHRVCLRNSCRGDDETAWYPAVHALFTIELPAPDSTSIVPAPASSPYFPTDLDRFLTVDTTRKITAAHILPSIPSVGLSLAVAFNPEFNPKDGTTSTYVRRAVLQVNAFNDPSIDDNVVILGVAVKPARRGRGGGGDIEAEYQVGVWGMKTLSLTRDLKAFSSQPMVDSNCDLALSVSVCGHVWNLHVTYWRSDAELVTHGPVAVGATDTLYGTMKIIKFVQRFKEWAQDEAWGDWRKLLEEAVVASTGDV